MRLPIHILSGLVGICCLGMQTVYADASNSAIMDALDLSGATGIDLVEQRWIKYQWTEDDGILTDGDGKNIIDSSSTTSKWNVQKGTWGREGIYPGVSPLKGSTCIRSAFPEACTVTNDAQSAQMVFKVTSGGLLVFSYMTGCDSSDPINVYVDGELVETMNDGYGMETAWGDGEYALPKAIINIPGGYAPAGSTYAGTFNHEIIIEFYKDDPNFYYDENDHAKYESWDQPVKPIKQDYVWDGYFDKENYDYDMGTYYSFKNCVWLDDFSWNPIRLKVNIGFEEDLTQPIELQDEGDIGLDTNAASFGCSIHYTVDGTSPTINSPKYNMTIDSNGYTSEDPIPIDHSCVLTVMAFSSNGSPLLETKTSRQIIVKASQPVLEKVMAEDSLTLTMSSKSQKNEIRYTLNASDPTGTSTLYDGKPLVIRDTCTVKAICTRKDIEPSEVVVVNVKRAEKPTTVYVTDSWGRPEPSHVYSGNDGLQVSCEAMAGYTQLYSIDGGAWQPYVSNSNLKVVAVSGRDRATVSFCNRKEGELLSEAMSVTIYKADDFWKILGEEGSETGDYQLVDGWNLLSIPLTMTAISERMFLQNFDMFVYNSANQAYEKVTSLKEGRAYWAFKQPKAGITANLSGAMKEDFAFDSLPKGWNAYGAVRNEPVPEGMIAWTYDKGNFKQATEFVRGIGYFIYKP